MCGHSKLLGSPLTVAMAAESAHQPDRSSGRDPQFHPELRQVQIATKLTFGNIEGLNGPPAPPAPTAESVAAAKAFKESLQGTHGVTAEDIDNYERFKLVQPAARAGLELWEEMAKNGRIKCRTVYNCVVLISVAFLRMCFCLCCRFNFVFSSSRMCRKMLHGRCSMTGVPSGTNHGASAKHRSRAALVIQRPYHHMIWRNYDFEQQISADRQEPGAAEYYFLGRAPCRFSRPSTMQSRFKSR